MSQEADRKVFDQIITQGGGRLAGFVGTAGRGVKIPVSQTALRRLAKEGFVEVETHYVSEWAYGPSRPRRYYYRNQPAYVNDASTQAECDAYDKAVAVLDKKQLAGSRSEVWIRITDRGMEYFRVLEATRI
jgi:hypothetical protein